MSQRMMRILGATLAVTSFNVHAVTIQFDSLAHDDDLQTYHGNSYTEAGFTLSGVPLYSNGMQHGNYLGSTGLSFGNQGVTGTLTADSGNPFTVASIDLGEVDLGEQSITFTGNLQGGGTTMTTFVKNSLQNPGFETFFFDSTFTNLVSLEWMNSGPYFHQFDNIVVTPVPAAAWLFGSGLLGLMGITRRRRSA